MCRLANFFFGSTSLMFFDLSLSGSPKEDKDSSSRTDKLSELDRDENERQRQLLALRAEEDLAEQQRQVLETTPCASEICFESFFFPVLVFRLKKPK